MYKFLEIAHTGLTAILLHPLRSVVTTASLVAILTPYTVGLAISQGLERQAEDSIRFGAHLYVIGTQFGRDVPVPLAAAVEIEKLDGVAAVIPRITGSITLGKDREPAVLVGIPVEALPPSTACVQGRLYTATSMNELVMGTELARRLNLTVGSLIPPFSRNERGERVSKVVGIFRSDVSLWQSRLVFTSFETAASIFDQEGLATHLLVLSTRLRGLGPLRDTPNEFRGFRSNACRTLSRDVAGGPESALAYRTASPWRHLQSSLSAGVYRRHLGHPGHVGFGAFGTPP